MSAPTLTRKQARSIDRLAIEEYGMSGLVLMENAGRGCTDILCQQGVAGPVVICCGKGNNAGDGFVIARHLDLRGRQAKVLLCTSPDKLLGDAATNYRILACTEVPIVAIDSDMSQKNILAHLAGADWIVDALLGTGSQGEPRPPLDKMIELLNSQSCRKLAVDLPSGLDCDSGQPASCTFRANHTCTFVAYKPGLLAASAEQYVGKIHVLDIGVPRKLIEEALLNNRF